MLHAIFTLPLHIQVTTPLFVSSVLSSGAQIVVANVANTS